MACFNLGAEVERLGRLQVTANTPEESAKVLDLAEYLATALVSRLQEAVPPQLTDPAVERMIGQYEQRAQALGDLGEAFLERNRVAYVEAARRQADAAGRADRLARSLGLTECLGFIGIRAG